MSQEFRIKEKGYINRNKIINFKFNGKNYTGYEGDTLASALLANGIHLVGRSFKYHRPRGFFAAGVDEPNAKLQVQLNGHSEPNVNATEIELVEGIEATSQNCWPSVKFDVGAVNNLLQKFFPAGFYYKTFMWPKSFWYKIYEPFIRKAAGLGVASIEKDKERYEHKFEYCDLLVTGSGPAGLASAYAAAKGGAKVILAEDKHRFGGSLLMDDVSIDNLSGKDWADKIISELKEMPNVTVKNRSQVFGYYDHNMLVMFERTGDHLEKKSEFIPRQRTQFFDQLIPSLDSRDAPGRCDRRRMRRARVTRRLEDASLSGRDGNSKPELGAVSSRAEALQLHAAAATRWQPGRHQRHQNHHQTMASNRFAPASPGHKRGQRAIWQGSSSSESCPAAPASSGAAAAST